VKKLKGLKSPKNHFKASNLILFGVMGAVDGVEVQFSGYMWAAKRAIKKKGMTFDELDVMCIDEYDFHFAILPRKVQDEVLKK